MSKRRTLSADGRRRAKRALWKKSEGKCFYCKVEMHNTSTMNDTQMTLDHLITLKDGGDNRHANLVAACRKCNTKRGSKLVAEFAGIKIKTCECEQPVVRRRGKTYVCVICKNEFQFKKEPA